MDEFSESELKRMKKLVQLQKVFRAILGEHVGLLTAAFLVFLFGVFGIFCYLAKTSPERFEASVAMHFHPKQTGKVGPYSDRYVMHVLKRQAILNHFTESVAAAADFGEEGGGPRNIRIEQEYKQTDFFRITLAAATEKDAVSYANMFAEMCVIAYTDERLGYLEHWKSTLEQKRQELATEMAQLDMKLNALNTSAVMVSPEKNYEYLQNRLTSERATLAKQTAELRLLEQQRKALDAQNLDRYPTLLNNVGRIHEYQETLAQLSQELQRLRENYTDRNPKVMAVANRRQLTEEEFHAFLREQGMDADDMEFLESAPALIREMNRLDGELASMVEMHDIQVKLVADLETDLQNFNEKFPLRQDYIRQQKKLSENIDNLEETVRDIDYLLPLVKDDLFIGEKARDAREHHPFTKANIVLSLLCAVGLTGMVVFLLLLHGYLHGKISSEAELETFEEFHYLGILPLEGSKFGPDLSERLFFSGIAHQFNSLKPLPKSVCLSALQGGELRPEFVQAFAEDCALEGLKVLVLQTIERQNFKVPPSPTVRRGAIATYDGGMGYLPVDNPSFLLPQEEKKLYQDMQLFRKIFDLVILAHYVPLTTDGLFFEQATAFCDAMAVVVGAKATGRRQVRWLQETQAKTSQRVMTILSGRIKSS